MRLHTTSSRRRGTVTVIVVAFLALLLVLGLSFAFYALRESEESRVYRDSVNGGATGVTPTGRTSSGLDDPPEPDSIANSVLGSVVYGAPDDVSGAFNALRCQELARTVYGWNPKFPSPYYGYNTPLPATFDPNQAAIQPFNGFGLVPSSKVGIPGMLPDNVVNWTWMGPGTMMFDPDNTYARDPRTPLVPWSYNPPSLGGPDRYWAKNADYTYPDLNNLFLAAVDPRTGRVLVPSYHRNWLVGQNPPQNPATGPIAGLPPTPVAGDPNPWTNGPGRFLMLRPRPVDNQWPPGSGMSEWRYPTMNPDGTYGDVELLTGKSSGQQLDAMWLDLDLPVRTWRGKSYKPLVAMLIVDQDGRVNLNTAGNFYPSPTTPGQFVHGSNQGVGPWEVNPSRVMLSYPDPLNPFNPVPNTFDDAQLTLGTQNPTLPATGGTPGMGCRGSIRAAHRCRSGCRSSSTARTPLTATRARPPGRPWCNSTARTCRPTAAGPISTAASISTAARAPASSRPTTPRGTSPASPGGPRSSGRRTSRTRTAASATGTTWTPARARSRSTTSGPITRRSSTRTCLRSRSFSDLTVAPGRVIPNRTFGVEELRALNGQFNYSLSSSSQLARLAQNTLGNPAFRYNPVSPTSSQLNARFATTVLSNDFDLPGSGPSRIQSQVYTPPQPGQPLTQPTSNGTVVDPTVAAVAGDEYDDSFRSRLTSILGPIDLDRKLTDYRYTTAYPLDFDLGMASNPRYNVGDTTRAIADRQQLAADIFVRLCRVTGVAPGSGVFTPTAGNPNQRWLAQLAVNIVDFIDPDDCITPFHWTAQNGGGAVPLANDQVANLQQYATNQQIKTEWVFGFERPRVNINEAYVRIENDPADPFPVDMNSGKKSASKDFDMKMWLELHNPLTPASANEQLVGSEGYLIGGDDDTHGGYRAALKDSLLGNTGTVYRVLLYRVNGQRLRRPAGRARDAGRRQRGRPAHHGCHGPGPERADGSATGADV